MRPGARGNEYVWVCWEVKKKKKKRWEVIVKGLNGVKPVCTHGRGRKTKQK